jgi:hypothetical protein
MIRTNGKRAPDSLGRERMGGSAKRAGGWIRVVTPPNFSRI